MYISIKLRRYFINFVGKVVNLFGYAIWAAAVSSVVISELSLVISLLTCFIYDRKKKTKKKNKKQKNKIRKALCNRRWLSSHQLHKVWETDMTFDLRPSDLTINRDHVLIKDYLPTKFEASGAKRCWVIRCTVWKTDMTFDLLTWLSIGIIYSSRTIYLPSLKLLGQSVVELSVAQGLRLTLPLTFDLTINRDHLLIKDYLPTKFEACGAKRCWVIRCTRFGRLTWPLTLDLLTWISIGIMYSSRTIYLPSLKLLGQSVIELSIAQGLRDWHDLWPWPSTYWPDYQ